MLAKKEELPLRLHTAHCAQETLGASQRPSVLLAPVEGDLCWRRCFGDSVDKAKVHRTTKIKLRNQLSLRLLIVFTDRCFMGRVILVRLLLAQPLVVHGAS